MLTPNSSNPMNSCNNNLENKGDFKIPHTQGSHRKVPPYVLAGRWIVVGLHRPYFEPSVYGTSITGDINNQKDLQSAFDDLFFQYGVRRCLHLFITTEHVTRIGTQEVSDNAVSLHTLHFQGWLLMLF